MDVCIIGAGRTRNGIGEYIGKYIRKHGGRVTSVLGTTKKTSAQAASSLKKYGIDARPYTDFYKMVRVEKPDAAVIASPVSTHHEYLLKCIDSGLHVFCEKPFIWNGRSDLRKRAEDIFEKAFKKGVVVAMNSQWSFSVDFYEAISGKVVIQPLNTFYVGMSPPFPGREMIPEGVPHALSLLYCFLGDGEIEHLNFKPEGKEVLEIRFDYCFGNQKCEAFIHLAFQDAPPRSFSFGLNDRIVSRSLNFENYEIYFNYEGKQIRIIDPLELSVKNFLRALEKETPPYVGALHILHNLSLLKKIDEGYDEFLKRAS